MKRCFNPDFIGANIPHSPFLSPHPSLRDFRMSKTHNFSGFPLRLESTILFS